MFPVITDLFTSKRFLVSLLATGAATYLCATGKISSDQLAVTIGKIAMVLTAAYGIENAAAAHGTSFPTPAASMTDPGPSQTQTINVTPAETPVAKAAAEGAK